MRGEDGEVPNMEPAPLSARASRGEDGEVPNMEPAPLSARASRGDDAPREPTIPAESFESYWRRSDTPGIGVVLD